MTNIKKLFNRIKSLDSDTKRIDKVTDDLYKIITDTDLNKLNEVINENGLTIAKENMFNNIMLVIEIFTG